MTTLTYELVSINPNDAFDSAPAWTGALGEWRGTLDVGHLVAESAREFASDAVARESLEPLLRAWEASAFLTDQHEILFRPEGSSAMPASAREQILRRSNTSYPAPDPDFARSPLVEELLGQIQGFREGSTQLPSAIATAVAGINNDPEVFNIDPEVMATLTELAHRGDSRPSGAAPLYRGPEWQWMQEALRLVTLQAGRRSSVPPRSRLTMADFRTRL